MKIRLMWLALAGLGIGSCSSEGSGPGGGEMLPDLPRLAARTGGLTVTTPIIRGLVPGRDVTYCTFTDVITTERMLVHNTLGSQSPYGHHAIMFYTPTPQEPRTVECVAADMDNFRQLLGGTGGENGAFWTPPENVAAEIPAGAQLIIQTHWTNYGERPVDVQAMMVTEPAVMRPDTVLAGPTVVTTTNFRIPPNARHHERTECTFAKTKRFMMVLGHQHERGQHVKIDIARADGSVDVVIDRDFTPADVFVPPVTTYPMDALLEVRAGDRVRVDCDWQNTGGESLEFPLEMCVFFGYSTDGETAYCVNGEWN